MTTNKFKNYDMSKLTPEQFKKMRASKEIPHDDEISKDQHNNAGYSNMDSGLPCCCAVIGIISVVIVIVIMLCLTGQF